MGKSVHILRTPVIVSAQFAKLPNGINHVSSTQINGVNRQLTVVTQNSNYQLA